MRTTHGSGAGMHTPLFIGHDSSVGEGWGAACEAGDGGTSVADESVRIQEREMIMIFETDFRDCSPWGTA